jgi:hypothetical protein
LQLQKNLIVQPYQPHPEMLKSISNGWPVVLSGLKTLLETGKPLSLKK